MQQLGSFFSLSNGSLSSPTVDLAYHMAMDGRPSQPHCPTSCHKDKTDLFLPQCITVLMSRISTPIPNAIVEINMRMVESHFLKSFKMCCRNSLLVWPWYTETKHSVESTTPLRYALRPREQVVALNCLTYWLSVNYCLRIIFLLNNNAIHQPHQITLDFVHLLMFPVQMNVRSIW